MFSSASGKYPITIPAIIVAIAIIVSFIVHALENLIFSASFSLYPLRASFAIYIATIIALAAAKYIIICTDSIPGNLQKSILLGGSLGGVL